MSEANNAGSNGARSGGPRRNSGKGPRPSGNADGSFRGGKPGGARGGSGSFRPRNGQGKPGAKDGQGQRSGRGERSGKRYDRDERGDRSGKRYASEGRNGRPGKRYDRDSRKPSRFDGKPGDNRGPKRYDRDGAGAPRSERVGREERFERNGKGRDGKFSGGKPEGRSFKGDSRKPDFEGRGPRRFQNGHEPRGGSKRFEDRERRGFRHDDGRRDERRQDEASSSPRKPNGFAGFNRDAQRKPRKPVRLAPARAAALDVLVYCRVNDAYLAEAFDKVLSQVELRKNDLAFARLLATEVVSRRGALDEMIDSTLREPETLEDDVRDALRIGFCEILYLGKPDYVAVDQGVELARSIRPATAGLANFALHRALDLKEEFPFGDPEIDDRAAALKHGFPSWLATMLIEQLGRADALRFMERSNEPAPLFFMINVARADGAETLKQLVSRGFRVLPMKAAEERPLAYPVFAFAERTVVGDELVERLLHEGALVISDLSAQAIAALAVPEQKPKRMLEIGAGRGTKTILLQNVALSRFGSQMALETLDVDPARTKERERRLKIARIDEARRFNKDATNLSMMDAGSYDAVFVDAPCSGFGTLRRHTDIRWRTSSDEVAAMAETAASMLEQAAGLVAEGGRLTYATCTVLDQENQEVVNAFLATEIGSRFTLKLQHLFDDLMVEGLQGPLSDSHFVAVFERIR